MSVVSAWSPPRAAGTPTGRDVGISLAWTLAVPALVAIAFLVAATAVRWPGSVVPWVLPVAAVPGAAGLWWWLIRRRRWGWGELGFTRPTRSLWHLLWETPLAIAASALIAALLGTLFGVSPSAASSTTTGTEATPLLSVALLLTGVLVVPMAEEVTFRQVLLGWIAARTPTWAAIVLTGVVFGLVHIAPPVICYVLPLGVALTALRVWHGTLWASLLTHAVNNLLVTCLILAAIR